MKRKNKSTLVVSNFTDFTIRKMRNDTFLKITFSGISENNFNSDDVTYETLNEVVLYLDIQHIPYFNQKSKDVLGKHFRELFNEIDRIQNAFKNGIHIPE